MSKKRYAPRIPRTANGFRAQDLRALPRGAWWTKSWLKGIEEMRIGARAGRGKVYAEQGQVSSLSVSGTHVEAAVLGARPDPYIVKLDFVSLESFRGCSLADICERIGDMSVGRILAGEMPTSIDEFFALEGVPLCPTLGRDHLWCSCPDWSKPCKHIAAVLYLLGDVMLRDPSLLLRLRGIDISDGVPSQEQSLPIWKGSERFNDFTDRVFRRVSR